MRRRVKPNMLNKASQNDLASASSRDFVSHFFKRHRRGFYFRSMKVAYLHLFILKLDESKLRLYCLPNCMLFRTNEFAIVSRETQKLTSSKHN